MSLGTFFEFSEPQFPHETEGNGCMFNSGPQQEFGSVQSLLSPSTLGPGVNCKLLQFLPGATVLAASVGLRLSTACWYLHRDVCWHSDG